jgi:signal transduction histidine kinase/PAS domain-containing protein
MPSTLRVKLVGDDPEIDKLEPVVRKFALTCTRAKDTEEACEAQELESADLFVLGAGEFSQAHINQIQKLNPAPEIFLAAGKKIPNLAKVMSASLLYVDWKDEEIAWQLEQAVSLFRRKRRLLALRDHRNRSWNIETNPAINLVTNVMRRCATAEQYSDILAALLTLRTVVDFHDCALVTLGEKGEVLEAWRHSKEMRESVEKISLGDSAHSGVSSLEDGKVAIFSSAEAGHAFWESFTIHPWSFSIAMRFSVAELPRRSRSAKSAVLVLYRRELVPFLERDQWLMELTYGPLALALEKVAMLKAISQASKEWRSTFDGISEPLTVIDRNYMIVKANKAFARLVEHDIKKLKGRRCYALLANRRQPCVSCPVGMSLQPQVGTRIQLQGKLKRDLLVWSYGIRTGLDSYHFQFYRNVSKETALASTLIQSEKMAALGKLVGAVAHEINNPLAGILATSQLMLDDAKQGSVDSALLEDVEEVRAAAWRSKKIIDDLLGFTSEAQALEEANVLDAVRSALGVARSALKDVAVKVHSEKVAPRAFVSVNSLQQVLFNLITNAAHAMNGKGTLEISIASEGESYRIDVRDNGPGIPAEKMKHIFDPFFTSKQEGSGTGLGLSIVRNLIQKMSARIEVSSAVGKGTEFRIFVPRGMEKPK